METVNINDKQGIEICGNAGQMLLDEHDYEDIWYRVRHVLPDCLENNGINTDDSNLADKLEWSVKMELEKVNLYLEPGLMFHQLFLGGDRFGE